MSRSERVPWDIYQVTLCIAKSYYKLLKRRGEIENDFAIIKTSSHIAGGREKDRISRRKENNEKKISAIERAWSELGDDTERELIKKNLYEGIPMQCIDLPMSIPSMKRARKKFLIFLAKNLGEL